MMFLKSIHIKNYNEIDDLFLDLTYPAGHEKVGKPLEKICIIGDNGTGKTTILELMRDAIYASENIENDSITSSIKNNDKAVITFNFFTEKQINGKAADSKFPVFHFPTSSPFFPSNLEETLRIKTAHQYPLPDEEVSVVHDSGGTTAVYEKKKITKDILYYKKKFFEQIKKQGEYGDFGKHLNFLLWYFGVELNTAINFDTFDEAALLSLKAKDDTVIPIDNWKPKVRDLIYTVLPLYTNPPERGVVLIDEAERALYPRTQGLMMPFYQAVCPDMQFVVTTYSPVIISSFEPWEVIELQFNEKGKVERKPYYEGENRMDNYKIYPGYLRWDSLYRKLFGMIGESHDKRTEGLMKLAKLDIELKHTEDKAKKKELFKKYEKIAELLDWASL